MRSGTICLDCTPHTSLLNDFSHSWISSALACRLEVVLVSKQKVWGLEKDWESFWIPYCPVLQITMNHVNGSSYLIFLSLPNHCPYFALGGVVSVNCSRDLFLRGQQFPLSTPACQCGCLNIKAHALHSLPLQWHFLSPSPPARFALARVFCCVVLWFLKHYDYYYDYMICIMVVVLSRLIPLVG